MQYVGVSDRQVDAEGQGVSRKEGVLARRGVFLCYPFGQRLRSRRGLAAFQPTITPK